MPQNNKPGFLRGALGRIGDKFVWGDNYNRDTGQWNSTPGQVLGGIGSRALNMFVPGAGSLVNTLGNGYYGQGPAARFFGPGKPQMEHFGGDTSLDVPNIGFNPSIGGVMPPQMGGSDPAAPQPWTGSLAGSNPFGGQYGGNLGGIPTMPTVNVRPIGGALNFGAGTLNNGVGAGTGYGAANFGNDAWGNTARGFGIGMGSGGSGGSFALSDAQKAAGINRV